MEEFISGLDTARFGFKIAKIENFAGDTGALLVKLKAYGVKMVIGRAKSSDIRKLNEMENNGFRIMDTQLTYRFDIKDMNADRDTGRDDLIIRGHTPGDTDKIVEIAGEAFDNYGHYFADPRLDRARCAEIYRDWAKRSCEAGGIADMVFVAQKQGQVAGFATFKKTGEGDTLHGVCGLGAVSPALRGGGIYPAIIGAALNWGRKEGLIWEEYSCLTGNFPANRAYVNSGFKPADSFITLHCWLG